MRLILFIVVLVLSGCAQYGQLDNLASTAAVELDADANGACDISKGCSNSTTAAGARTNLGLAIGSDVQAYSATNVESGDIDTLAKVNAIIGDATLLDDGAIADSTAIGLTTGDNYTNFGVVTDDSINELMAAIDTALASAGGDDLGDVDTLAELNSAIADATILDDGAIADSTAIGLTTGDNYTNYGVVTDNSINELLAAIDTAIGGLAGGHDAVTLDTDVSAVTLTDQVIGTDATVEQLADLTPVNSSVLGFDGSGNIDTYAAGETLPFAIGVTTTNFGTNFANDTDHDTVQELFDIIDDLSLGGTTELSDDTTPVLGGNLDISTFNIEGVDATEFGYVDGVTSDIQTQFSNILDGTTAFTDFNGADIIDSDNYAASSIDLEHLSAGAKFQSLAVADLTDSTTPSVLTAAETTNKVISNYKASGADHVFTLPAAHAAANVIFAIGDEFQIDIEPDSGENFYLNGTAMAADEHIQNTADTLGQRIVGYCVNINGSLTWMFYSSDSDFVEETP